MSTDTAPRRIEIDSSLCPVSIPAEVYNELCRHALETYPEECCGLVIGNGHERYQRVYRCTNVMTKKHLSDPESFPRDARHAYYMNEVEYMKAQEEAEANGETVTAIYHSHVDAAAYLSEDDLHFADHVLFPFPEACQIVMGSSEHGVRDKAVFVRDAETGEFSGHPVTVLK